MGSDLVFDIATVDQQPAPELAVVALSEAEICNHVHHALKIFRNSPCLLF